MTNEELKKKIVEILNDVTTEPMIYKGRYLGDTQMPELKINAIADALIAAGIGDVKDVEAEANRYEMLYKLQNRDMALAERRAHDVEHRAEVAERAFSNCLEKFLKFQYEQNCCLLDKFFLEEVNKKCLQQAEKELHEERKDE